MPSLRRWVTASVCTGLLTAGIGITSTASANTVTTSGSSSRAVHDWCEPRSFIAPDGTYYSWQKWVKTNTGHTAARWMMKKKNGNIYYFTSGPCK